MKMRLPEWLGPRLLPESESEPSYPDILTPADLPSRFEGVTVLERIALLNKTIVVNFSETPHFTDPNSALMCVVLLTSDGKMGTLTHIDIHANVEAIVHRLKQVLPTSHPLCLTGAENHISDNLLRKLRFFLEKEGFAVPTTFPSAELGGRNVVRRATLYPSSVLVEKSTRGNEPEWLRLSFATR
jgi:hypothetical protein